MIVILGLVILLAAGIAGAAGVLANGGHAHAVTHFAVFGYHVTGQRDTARAYMVHDEQQDFTAGMPGDDGSARNGSDPAVRGPSVSERLLGRRPAHPQAAPQPAPLPSQALAASAQPGPPAGQAAVVPAAPPAPAQ
jgi:hypothetical protein